MPHFIKCDHIIHQQQIKFFLLCFHIFGVRKLDSYFKELRLYCFDIFVLIFN